MNKYIILGIDFDSQFFFPPHARQVSELDASLVLQLMESEIAIRAKATEPNTIRVASHKLRHVFQRMSLTGLVSTLCTSLPDDRFPKMLRKELERARKLARKSSSEILG